MIKHISLGGALLGEIHELKISVMYKQVRSPHSNYSNATKIRLFPDVVLLSVPPFVASPGDAIPCAIDIHTCMFH